MPAPKERTDILLRQERAVLAAVHLPESRFDTRDPLGELRSLAETAGATVVGELTQNRNVPEAGTYMGKGKLGELRAMCAELNAGVVIFDHELSPKQIAAIEEAVEVKVLDRSELILDIFAGRATTHEAKLQVELAQLQYTYPRLRAMWSHLERIVGHGGIGGIGTRGPGEQQLEIDRRLVQRRTVALKREIEEIQARKSREVRARNVESFTVGIVGYTNAGKSTLFNTLTAGGAFANDQLFATLVTRTREWRLGGGLNVMLSDTVGFVRDLPTHLVASFRATLEEATHANLLLVVLDVSDPAAELQYQTVTETLDALEADVRRIDERAGFDYTPPRRIVLLNKVDKLRDPAELRLWEARLGSTNGERNSIPFCATRKDTPEHDELVARVRSLAVGHVDELEITLPMAESRAVTLIEKQGEVLERRYDGPNVVLRARLGSRQVERLRAGGTRLTVRPAAGE
ncbi:MAG: GTPase HflX [Planctomycetes bacterium]|nr:GTPase HflX [Planctomycetota bacterium]